MSSPRREPATPWCPPSDQLIGQPALDSRACVVIEPRTAWSIVDWRGVWRYRELLALLVWRDIQVRYKQTVLGAAWALLQPLLTMAVFTLFFGRLGGLASRVDGSYPLFVLAALLPWLLFSNAVGQAGQSLINGSQLISKVYFPRLIIPLSAVGGAIVDFAVSLGLMFLLLALCGVWPGWGLLLLPVVALGTILTAVAVGTLLSALIIEYRDFRHVTPFLLQLWMYASPIAYPTAIVPPEFRLVFALNPLVGLIDGFRSALLGQPLEVASVTVSLGVTLVLLSVALVYFRRLERRFADIV